MAVRIEIERGIPIPAPAPGFRRNRPTNKDYVLAIRSLDVGESFVFTGTSEQAGRLRQAAKLAHPEREFATRTVGANQVRVWRVLQGVE